MSRLPPSQSANDFEEKSDRPNPVDVDYESSDHKRVATAHPTPTKRRQARSSLLTFQRRNVDDEVRKLEPGADSTYCVVTHAPPTYTIIEYAHLVPSATPDADLDKLEWAWNAENKSTDINTENNIHPLDINLHRYFDRTKDNLHNGWFWLPCGERALNIITNMRQYYVGTRSSTPSPAQYPNARRNPCEFYPKYASFKFRYRFVPFPAMETSWAVRQLNFPIKKFSPQTKVEQYYYPFETLRRVTLHVPYHFVIFDTGRKLSGIYTSPDLLENKLEEDFPWLDAAELLALEAAKYIYEAWMASKPDWLKEALSNDEHTSGGSDDSGSPGSGDSSGDGSDADGSDTYDSDADGSDTERSDQNSSAQDGVHSQGGFEQGSRRARIARRAGTHSSSLAPEDSGSCVDTVEDFEDSDAYEEEARPEDEDSDEEYEDPEWLARLHAWVEEVCEASQATHERTGSPSSSPADLVATPGLVEDSDDATASLAVEPPATDNSAVPSIGRTESPYMAPCVV